MRSLRVILAGMLLGACTLTCAAGVVRSKTNVAQQKKISQQLDQFQMTSFGLRAYADQYQALVRYRDLSYRSHASNLNSMREQVNNMGRQLLALEKVKARADENQQLAITEAREGLSELTPHMNAAIGMHTETPAIEQFPAYQQEVKSIYTHADKLYTRVHAVRKYEKARQNLDQVLSPGL